MFCIPVAVPFNNGYSICDYSVLYSVSVLLTFLLFSKLVFNVVFFSLYFIAQVVVCRLADCVSVQCGGDVGGDGSERRGHGNVLHRTQQVSFLHMNTNTQWFLECLRRCMQASVFVHQPFRTLTDYFPPT